MRLHRLSVTAFGPFGGTQHVDFDELSAAGLFLLHGPTGAGKTSVLDAVCFALYGSVPGARQQPGGTLRSDHAEAHTLTEVVLDLTVGGRRLEVTRRPEQLRPKRRGDGYTTEKAQSWLREYRSGAWDGLSRSHQEIGEELTQLTGMSRDQFCQVVLLPQGDFARFLRAGAEDRAKLLGKLFDTGRFAAVEEQLAGMRRTAQERVRAADEALTGLAQRMRQAAGPGAPEAPGLWEAEDGAEPGLPDQRRRTGRRSGTAKQRAERREPAPADPELAQTVLGWAALARAEARERRDIAASALRLTERAQGEAAARLDEERGLARAQDRHAALRQRAAALESVAAEREETAGRLRRAQAAEAVAPAAALCAAAREEHARAARAEQTARAQLPPGTAEESPAALTERERALRQELGSLDAARRAEARTAALTDEVAALDREARADEDLQREAAEWLAGWESRRHTHQRRVDAAHEAATRTEQLAGQLGPLRQRLEAARRRDKLEETARGTEEELLRAREAAAAAQEHWLALKERRLRGIAAELARELSAGEPCAVCGATEHPAPARAGEGHVDRAAEEAALAASRAAEESRDRAEHRAMGVREELAAARAESGGDGTDGLESTDRLAEAVAELEERHTAARAAAGDAHAAREALDAAEREHDRRQEQHQEAARRAAARTSRREALQREHEELAAQLAQARGEEGSVEARAAVLERRAALLAEAAETARAAGTAARARDDAEARLAEAAARARFASPEEAVAAVLGEDEQAALRHRLESWQAEEAAVEAESGEPELVRAAALPPAEVAAAEAAAESATRRLREAYATEETARARCADLDALTAEAVTGVRETAPLRAHAARVARIASLAAGTSAENERKMRLESYVLAARLEQVAAAAGIRLAAMSAGRYTLVHSDERTGGRGRSGLGLHVVDSWTGVRRDTSTLSGGETFSASLALALGLADVVAEEAGGTRLETLFIDEGFGSLDEETLDEVLDVLDSLRERDRCVGIVSHVADLRRRIPAQLQVTKSRTGSGLRLRGAPLAD
ncbi:AAA family ATPase [Streptomyces sp. HNM0574]|uniref:AAA family ATPase n=1 Tax=Streptomyces sp. HNM0574 TaxID=2714954 RepID=UPI00146D9D14|nr:AAA family ATPase [Streptomyces sp. HNM0574]NLU69885.1 AAA family ATPase [Streptomyces sp. HNM0574]